MESVYTLKQDIIEIGRRIWLRGFAAANDGNISARIDNNRVIATPTGLSKGFLTPDQLVICDMEGNKISGSLKPSSEMFMHLMVYREREDIRGIVHAHPPTVTGFATAHVSLAECVLPEVIVGLGSVATTEYATPGTQELPDEIKKYIHDYDAFLMENHGALTIGPNVMNAYYKMETIEHFAKIMLVANQLGGVKILSKEHVTKLMELREKLGVKGKNPGCETCERCEKCAFSPKKNLNLPGNVSELPQDALINEITHRILAVLQK